MSVVARGHVSDRPFARSVYWIAAKRFTGDLILSQDGQEYRLTWHQGAVIEARSASPADSEGRVALTAGLVTSTQLGEVLRRVSESPGRDQLDALVEVARLSPEQRLAVKRRAMAHRALRIFALEQASFELDDAPTMARDPELPSLSVRWLIYQGLRAHFTEERLAADLTAVDGMRLRVSEQGRAHLGEFGFGLAERRWVGAMIGQAEARAQSLDEIVAACPDLTRKDVMVMVYALLATDALEAASGTRRPLSEAGAASGPAARPQAQPAARPAAAPGQTSASIRPGAGGHQGRTEPLHLIPRPGSTPGRPGAPGAESPARETPPEQPVEPAQRQITARLASARAHAVKVKRTRRRTTLQPVSASEIRRVIAEKAGALEAGADYFQLLGVPRDASEQAVRDAYFELAAKLHPDRLRAAGIADLTAESQRVCAEINVAFSVLSHAGKRGKYLATLAAGGAAGGAKGQQAAESMASRLMQAEEQFRRGEWSLRRGRWAEAHAAFEKAVELNPDEAEHHALLAWTIWCAAEDKPSVRDEVMACFQRAVDLSPKSLAALYYRGRVASMEQDPATATRCFQRVVDMDASYQDASLQLRLIQSRQQQKDSKTSGLLRRLTQTGRVPSVPKKPPRK